MKNKHTLFCILILVSYSSIAQVQPSISPNEQTEFCPNVNITFTVTLPKIQGGTTPTIGSWTNSPIIVSGITNLTSNSTQTTFNFVGKFNDKNINQVYQIIYTKDGESTSSYYYPSFKKIKSLYFDNTSTLTSCFPIQPNQSSITAPLCEISNIPISFDNIKWSTSGENPAYCFGTITTYEYLLPAGWPIGSNVSIGNNWIPGGKSVTITTDASTGDNSDIQIRATNNCATGLSNNQTPAYIHISRPQPTFTISPASTQIQCTSTASKTFTVQTTGTVVCSLSYNWDLGANNHWIYNGSAAPASFSTTTNSITLTPAC